jgi:hypothetical protein
MGNHKLSIGNIFAQFFDKIKKKGKKIKSIDTTLTPC